MGNEVLTLNTTGGRLWRTVRRPIAECISELHGAPHECRLGGGTTLAARWHHRDSFDVDLTVSTGANLSSLGPRFEETMAKLGGKADYLEGQWKVGFEAGQVDLSKLQPVPAGAQHTALVDDEPFTVLSILHGKMERATRSPVRDVFDVIKAARLEPEALAIAVNARTRLTSEVICMTWERTNKTFEQETHDQLLGVPDAMREDPATLGLKAAAAVQGALYRRVTMHTDDRLTVVETETKNGAARRIVIPPADIDREFAVNGLTEYFYFNVMGGERMLEAARAAVTGPTPTELHWETGQIAPVLQRNLPEKDLGRNP